LYFLIKSSDYFTDAAEKIGIWLGIPAFIVGVTIVSIGTSLPELASSIAAVFNPAVGASSIVAGNVIGSNITNILLVLGIASLFVKKMKISWELISVDLPLLFGSAAVLIFLIFDDFIFWIISHGLTNLSNVKPQITWLESITCIIGFMIYVTYTASNRPSKDHRVKRKKLGWKTPVIIMASIAIIYFSAKYTVESVVHIGTIIGVSQAILAATAIAIGTSLPELMVTITAVRKKKFELAIGNVLGSNIFNTFMVIGIPGVLSAFSPVSGLAVDTSIWLIALPFMLAATFLYIFMTQDNTLTRYEGLMLLLMYVIFIGILFWSEFSRIAAGTIINL